MAFTFKKVLIPEFEIGKSLYDEEGAKIVPQLMETAAAKNVKIILPVDYVTGDAFSEDAKVGSATDKTGIPKECLGLDCGPESAKLFKEAILDAKTILWNGPPGVFEMEKFSHCTKATLEAAAQSVKNGNTVIVGGGDTATAAVKFGVDDKLSHVSTGGGASIELIEGKPLPGVNALSTK